MKMLQRSAAWNAGVVLMLAASCAEPTAAPGTKTIGITTHVPPSTQAGAGAAIVAEGIARSATDSVVESMGHDGRAKYFLALEDGRRRAAVTLDSVQRTGAVIPGGTANLQVTSGEDVELGPSTLGLAAVYSVTTAVGFSGTDGQATGQVSFRGTDADISVTAGARYTVGGHPPVGGSAIQETVGNSVDSWAQCVQTNTSQPSVCGNSAYAELNVPTIHAEQPCGTTIYGTSSAVARINFAGIGAVLDVIANMVRWKLEQPVLSSAPFLEASEKTAAAPGCVAPIVSATWGYANEDSPGQYSVTVSDSGNLAQVQANVVVTNSPLPRATPVAVVDGDSVGNGQLVELGVGTHTLTGVATDPILHQTGSSSATLTVSAACAESGSGATTLKVWVGPRLRRTGSGLARPLFSCGAEGGSPGGGEPPADDPVYGCYWARDFVIYTDGTWDWLTDWFQVCGWAELRGDSTSENVASSDSRQASAIRVRVVGSGRQPNGRVATVVRLNGESDGAEIALDTTRASHADIENALASAQLLIDGGARSGGGSLRAVIADAPLIERNAIEFQRVARDFLRQLKTAPERTDNQTGKGRTLHLVVERRGVHRVQRTP